MSTEFIVGAFVLALAAAVGWDWWRSRDSAPPAERGFRRRSAGKTLGGGAAGAAGVASVVVETGGAEGGSGGGDAGGDGGGGDGGC